MRFLPLQRSAYYAVATPIYKPARLPSEAMAGAGLAIHRLAAYVFLAAARALARPAANALHGANLESRPAMAKSGQHLPAASKAQQTAKILLDKYGLSLSVPDAGKRYELYDELGRGGVSRIHLAYDKDVQREVAIKTLREKYHSDHNALARFMNEAKVTAKLQHPNIPHVYDTGFLSNGELFFAMERVDGRTLRELLDERRADPKRTSRQRLLRIFAQVCQTVAYAHHNRVVHRDLKPDNIMVGEYNRVYVLDWGLAIDLSEDDEPPAGPEAEATAAKRRTARSGKGTPRYMSPEQVLGINRQVDCRSDVFSLGIVLHEILADEHPFEREDLRTTLHAIASEDAPPLKGAMRAGGLADICAKAMSKAPAERYPDASLLAEDAERALEHRTISLKSDQLSHHVISYWRRNWGLVGLFVALVALGGWTGVRVRQWRRDFNGVLHMSKTHLNAARRLGRQAQQVEQQLPAGEAEVGRLLANVKARQVAEEQTARVLLTAALKQDSRRFPAWGVPVLKTLWLAELNRHLGHGEKVLARKVFEELRQFLDDGNEVMQWTPEEREVIGAWRQLLAADAGS